MSNPAEILPQLSCKLNNLPLNEGGKTPQQQHPLLKDRYQIVEYLSRGSFGETFIAQDLDYPDHPQCVVKRFDPTQSYGQDALVGIRERFYQEARVLKNLGQHQQIPYLLAYFEFEGEFYLVQEFIPGPSLQQLIAEKSQWPIEFVLKLLTEVLEILVFVHSQNVIHRDIKPDNILYRQTDDRWVLIDFGSVKQLVEAPPLLEFGPYTMTIHSKGYTPSEQFEGCPCSASDLYSLGMTALQCLTGQYPNTFKPNLRDHGLTWLVSIVGCPDLATILDKMTRALASERYPSAQAALEDIYTLVGQAQSPLSAVAQLSSHRTFPESYTPTEMRQPTPPPQPQTIKIPTKILAPTPPPAGQSTQLPPIELAADSQSPDLETHSTEEPQVNIWAKQVAAVVQSYVWNWFKAHNIYRLQDAIAFVACVSLLLGVAGTMTWWVVTVVSLPRQPSVVPIQPTTADSLVATLSGDSTIHNLAFNANNTRLFSADDTGVITAWDIVSKQPIQQIKNSDSLTSFTLSSTHLASGDEYANVNLWNLNTGKLIYTLREHQLPILSLIFSPDCKTLFTASEDKKLIRWQLELAEPKPHITEVPSPITAMAISLDGQYLVTGSTDFTLKVWNAHNGDLVNTLIGHSGAIQSIAISSNGAVIVSGSADQTIKVWNLYTGELINTLTGQYGAINAIDFSPNGQIFASGSEDGTIWLWDLYSGEIIQKLSTYQGSISDVDISSDGQLLASSTTTGNINLWKISKTLSP